LQVLADRSGANLSGDWPGLGQIRIYASGPDDISISATQPVTLELENATLAQALDALCEALPSTDDQRIGVGENPAGILLLGSANLTHRSVTTLPKFYNVDDLIEPTAKYAPPSTEPSYEFLLAREARRDLQSLAIALEPFVHTADVGCFGQRLLVNGYLQSHQEIAAILDRMRNPVRLSSSTTRALTKILSKAIFLSKLPPVPIFIVPPEGMTGWDAIKKWQAAGDRFAVIDLTDAELGEIADTVGFELHDATLEEIAQQIVGFPFTVVPRGVEDNRVHIRRGRDVQPEQITQAYDVSTILAHPEGWIKDTNSLINTNERLDNGELLIRLLTSHLDSHCDFRLPSSSPEVREAVSCWKGILLIQAPDAIHIQIMEFLEHLQRTGRPYDPPPED
jgi:hypothetical protein